MVAVIGYRPLIESHDEWQKRKDCVFFGDRVSPLSSNVYVLVNYTHLPF